MLDSNHYNVGNKTSLNIFGIEITLFHLLLIGGNILVVLICLVLMIYICYCKKNKMNQKYIRTPSKEIDEEEQSDDQDNEEDKALNV